MVNRNAIVKSISFNIEIDGHKYKDVCVNYDIKDRLKMGDIHSEDNNSWRLVEIGGKTYDFQIYGDDDSIIYKGGKKNLDNIMKSRLSIQLYEMYKSGGKWCHSSDILCSLDGSAKITYVRIDTTQGRKFANLLQVLE